MLHPAAEFLGGNSELHRVRRVRALHHHALEEIAAERTVRNAEALVKRERIGVRVSTVGWWRGERGQSTTLD